MCLMEIVMEIVYETPETFGRDIVLLLRTVEKEIGIQRDLCVQHFLPMKYLGINTAGK